ncbi:uncharacterized protein METZ01_LOCUS495344 [marine metagenome]|uniref:Uncharacterized protein n=1 Tax=marine metagenome TaxID=408172 RepID=A0A383DDU6_9ZZZZ
MAASPKDSVINAKPASFHNYHNLVTGEAGDKQPYARFATSVFSLIT